MRIETVCTGDELLTGLTIDTNSRYFQTRLLDTLGLTVTRNTVVGDVPEEIIEVLSQAAARSDAVLVSGGLGPTSDDYTAECAAKFGGVPLVESIAARTHLEDRFRSRGYALTANNLRQALVPEGAEVILNAVGSAPMFAMTVGRCLLMFVPGVPKEYLHLVEHEVLPRVKQRAGHTGYARLKLLKTVGLPESHLDAKIRPLYPLHPKVTFGYRTHAPENHLKLLAVAEDPALAEAALAAAEAASREVLGDFVFAEGDESLAGAVGALLRARKQTLAVAESCTGGRICAAMTSEAGASDWLIGGAVAYRESAKETWLGVKHATLVAHTAVSGEVAAEMASGARAALKADWAVSVTGYAGPTGGDAKNPVGTIFIAVQGPEAPPAVERHHCAFANDRDRVQQFAAWTAMESLRRALRGAAR